MAVIDVALEAIDDNPYNPRKHYPQAKVNEMSQSLREVGLRQVPEGRHVDGRVQLAYGHMRLRGFAANQRKDPEHWKTMPVDVKEISDQDMFHYSMEENLRRTDITPIEVARCIEAFSEMFPDVTEKDLGEKHGMTEANVSNMKRVLRLPEKILEKIDEGKITFTQGRELLIFERFENGENLMRSALDGLKIGNKAYGHANTVEGIQVAVHDVVGNHCRPLDKQWEGYRFDILFDTRAAGCLDCENMIRTHPTKSATAHWCLNSECWEKKQDEHREKAAEAAKAKMQAEVINQAAQMIAQEEKAPLPTPVMRDENTVLVDQETFAKIEASNSCDRISEGTAVKRPVEFDGKLYLATSSGMGKVEAYQLVPREQFTGAPRTYRVPADRESDEYYESLRNDPNGFYHGMLVKRGQVEHVLIGPEVTFVTKVDEGDFSQEKLPSHVEAKEEIPPAAQEIPEDILTLAREKAGTRADVLDINDICGADPYRRQVKPSYAVLKGGYFDELRYMDDVEECTERCTHGFHFGFDSKEGKGIVYFICSDTKCVVRKKAASTQARNAEGQARKKAEIKAVKEAITQTTTLDRPRIKLILLAQLDGKHTQSYYYEGTKKPETWLWERLSAGTPAIAREREDLFKRIDKLTNEELAQLVVEFMFYYLTDKGDIGAYEIKAAKPLKWMGIDISIEPPRAT